MKAKVLKTIRVDSGTETSVVGPGSVIEIDEEDAAPLVEKGYLRLVDERPPKEILDEFMKCAREIFEDLTLEPCMACREKKWWLSTYGAIVCGICHPPGSEALVERWL